MKSIDDAIDQAAAICIEEADRQAAHEASVRDHGLKVAHAAIGYVLMAVAQRIRELKKR